MKNLKRQMGGGWKQKPKCEPVIDKNLFRQLIYQIEQKPISEELREGTEKTPERAAKAFEFLTSGYHVNLDELVNEAIFDAKGCDELVIVNDIEFHSVCEHHLLSFTGKAHVGYIPNKKVIGLSKIPRIVDMFSRRLQIQEKLTREIMDCLVELLDPIGCGVIMEGQHLCMQARGVMKSAAYMRTCSLSGCFKEQPDARMEFLSLVGVNR